MTSDLFILTGIYMCLTGTLLGGILALLGRAKAIQRTSQVITLIGLASGLAASFLFLVIDRQPLLIFTSDFFFPGKSIVIDHLSAIFFLLINLIGVLAVLYGLKYIEHEKGHYNISYVQFLSSIFILGMQLVTLATTPVFFMFAWEIMSFSSFLLVMADLRTDSIRPAVFYLIMTHLGAGAILAGFLFLSGGLFGLDFTQLANLASNLPVGTLMVAFLLFFFGFGSKAGLFPFHGWLPEAHPQAPSHISALMSGVMLKVAVYGMIRVILFILPVLPLEIGFLVVIVGLFSAIFGVFYSLIETDIKRILAFSSIENLGLIFSMIGIYLVATNLHMDLLAQVSLVAALYQSVCHALFKSGLFLSAGIAGQAFHTRNIEKMGGMAKHMKFFSLAVLLLSLTAAALPPSGAFISEWLVIQSVIGSVALAPFGFKVLLLAVLVCLGLVAGMAVFSMVRFFGIAFLARPRSPEAQIDRDPVKEMLFPVIFLGIAAFLLGSLSQPVIGIIGKSLGGGQGMSLIPENFNPFTFNPFVLLVILAILFALVLLLRRTGSDVKQERIYHTWDCGQPTDASMEYSATAFSAPIRFLFKILLRAKKKVSTQPLVEGNPWLVKKSVSLEIKPIWDRYFYNPIVRLVSAVSSRVHRLQNGNIQFYITLIFISLIITAIVTL